MVAADDSSQNVTGQTTFSIRFSAAKTSRRIRPDGSCTGATCTATKYGRHTVTGTLDLGGSTISGTAALQVVPRHRQRGRPWPIVELRLEPATATIGLGKGGQQYHAIATARDGSEHDVTAGTTFTFQQDDGNPSGDCPDAICSPPEVGSYTVTGTFRQQGHRTLTAAATLLVVYTNLSLEPSNATIWLGDGREYHAFADDRYDVTDETTFIFKKMGSSLSSPCPDAICTPPKTGAYTIRGTFPQPDGRTLTAEATLLVVHKTLSLKPPSAMIGLGEGKKYQALADGIYDVSAGTTFTFKREDGSLSGSCPDATCRPPKTGRYTITGTFAQPDGRTLTAQATLLVVYTRLSLEPGTATIGLGETKTYQAFANGDQVTARTTFTFQQDDGSPSGDCPDATCTPSEVGSYLITGSFAQPDGPTLTAQAKLLVRQEKLASLELHPTPASGVIESGDKVTYSVHGLDASGKHLEPPDDLAPFTRFEIDPPGSCTGATCTATPPRQYKVTARLADDPKINGFATLLVVRRDLASLELHPDTAVIQFGGKVTYSAHGLDANGKHLGRPDDLAPFIHFDMDPKSGSCTGRTCTATAIGQYTVTGTLPQPDGRTLSAKATLLVVPGDITSLELHPKPDPAVIKPGGEVIYSVHGLSKSGNHLDQLGDLAPFTTFNIDRDGSCTGATCTATKLGQHAVTATLDLSDRDVTGKATLRVATTAPNCTPSASDVRTLEVTPGKGATRTQLRITGKVNPALANCLLRIFFGGSNLGDVTVGSDGSVSERRTVPQDTKPGTIPVGLATTGGQVLVERFFQVTAEPTPWPPWERGLPWLLFILLLLLLAVPALLRERARRQRRWVHKHFRAEPHPSADDLTSLDQDSESEPSFSWRLQAHGDAGSQTLKEGD